VLLITHLCFCDLMYCVLGIPFVGLVYANGYFPLSHEACRITAIFRYLIAYADFNTLAATSACIAWNQLKPNKEINSKRTIIFIIIGIWIEVVLLVSLPLFNVVGEFGYDLQNGKCALIECSNWMDFETDIYLSPGAVILSIGVGLPFLVVLVSYGIVFRILDQQQNLYQSVSSGQYKRSTVILTLCYFVFILPICIIEWVPITIKGKDLIHALVFSWYLLTYIVNVFVYVIYLPRCREAIILMFRDIFSCLDLGSITDQLTMTDIGVNVGSKVKESHDLD